MDRLDGLRTIPGPDPGACPKCGKWRKAGMLHICPERLEGVLGDYRLPLDPDELAAALAATRQEGSSS